MFQSNPYPIYYPPYSNKYDLPEALNETINGICEPIEVQAEMGLSVVLAALATAAQGAYDVQLPFGKIVPLSLYVLVSAPSGVGKTTVANELLKPLSQHQIVLQQQYKDQMPSLKAKRLAWDLGLKELEKRLKKAFTKSDNQEIEKSQQLLEAHLQSEPVQFSMPQMIVTDATSQALLQTMSDGQKSMCLYSSEGGVTIKNWQQSFVTQANALWDGDSITVSRKGSGTSTIHDTRMGILVLLQPDILMKMKQSNALMRESGFFARFLVCEVPRNVRNDSEIKHTQLHISYQRVMERLLQRTEQVKEGLYEKAIITCSEGAIQKWKDYTYQLEQQSQPNQMYGNATDFTAKVGNLLCRIAGVLALFEHDGKDESVIISEQHMHSATNMMNYYLQQFMSMFDAQSNVDKLDIQAMKLMDWLRRCPENSLFNSNTLSSYKWIAKSDILRSGPPAIRKAKDLDVVLDYLLKKNQISLNNYSNSYNVRAKPIVLVGISNNSFDRFLD